MDKKLLEHSVLYVGCTNPENVVEMYNKNKEIIDCYTKTVIAFFRDTNSNYNLYSHVYTFKDGMIQFKGFAKKDDPIGVYWFWIKFNNDQDVSSIYIPFSKMEEEIEIIY